MSLKIDTILVPVDGSGPSERAVDFAAGLAAATGAALELVTVIDIGQVDVYEGFYLTEEQLDQRRAHLQAEVLERAAARVDPALGLSLRTRLLRGAVVKTLLAEIERPEIGLVVIGRTGRSALERILQGSVSERVAKRSADPVVLIP